MDSNDTALTKEEFRIHFQTGHIFKLHIPPLINIKQLTKIVINHRLLHAKYGQPQLSKDLQLKPIFLKCKFPNILFDFLLSNDKAQHFSFLQIPIRDFQTVYTSNEENGGNPLQCYQILDLEQESKVVRNKKNGIIYSLFSFKKEQLSYQQLQAIIYLKQYLARQNKFTYFHCSKLYETFESENYLHLVVDYAPINLQDTWIFGEETFSDYMDKVAKIIHCLDKDGFRLGNFKLSDLGVTADDRIIVKNIRILLQLNSNQIKKRMTAKNGQFGGKFRQFFQKMKRNLNVNDREFVLELNQVIGQGRIVKYLDYLMYRYGQTQKKDHFIMKISFNNFIKNSLSFPSPFIRKRSFQQFFPSSQGSFEPLVGYFSFRNQIENPINNEDQKTVIRGNKKVQKKNKRARSVNTSSKSERKVSEFKI